jgi:FKBP-type peptidyl-prolyl cis-trans isomerase (trigger factor)
MTDGRIIDENIDGLTHTYRATLDGAHIANVVDGKLRELGRTTPVPGFRPGRSPLSILRKIHGNKVRNAVVDRMAIELARRLIVEKKLEPVRRPIIRIDEECLNSTGPVEFFLVLEVAPQFELGPVEGFRLQRPRQAENDPTLALQAQAHVRRQLFDALMERYDFPIPGDMVEAEYKQIAFGYETEVGETVGPRTECELRKIAARRIRLAILLAEIGRVHKINIQRAEVEALIEQQADLDPAHRAEITDYYLDHPTALAELQSPLFEQRVVDFLLERCEIEEVELSAEELHSIPGLA